ncbi:MAG: Rieske 2Fe-2S domain-containing protein [Acidimicrobiia bacterium]|nr:Rieske 2Fe-2S domain-containing protein [Acidimicrobiia bacterium]
MTEPGSDPPIWRRDFPYTAAGEEGVTRREFTKFLMAASVAIAGSGGVVSLWTSLRRVNTGEPRQVVAREQLPVGGSHLFDYPTDKDPAILLRPDADTIIGFSQKCTHLGCVVFWEPEEAELHCPCHEGIFNLEGEPVAGPPERPLGRIDVELRDDMIWALGTSSTS